MKIYVASSWRNERQPAVVRRLQAEHEVYDFRNPPGRTGFSWSAIDTNWLLWTPDAYRSALYLPLAKAGFAADIRGMQWADACVLVLPCGRSAHVEAGWFAGQGKPVYVLLEEPTEPELMYKLFDSESGRARLALDMDELVLDLAELAAENTANCDAKEGKT